MRKKVFRKYIVPEYIKECLEALMPPEQLSVSEWAEKYRVLDSKTAAMPGPWRNSITPYLIGIMDEFNNPETEEIIFVKPTQVGGTECLHNMLGYVICQDPAPAMVVYPTEPLAKSVSTNRMQPMFTSSPEIAKHFDEYNSSDLELQFDDMYLSLAGSNSPTALASKPIKYLFIDEVDKFPGASKREADPVNLAKERTKTFHNRKVFITSTPTLKSGHIWKNLEGADIVKHYFVPCPHCGKYIEFKFSQIKWPDNQDMSYADRAELAFYVCQECGAVINDSHKQEMLRFGKWQTVETHTRYVRKVAFWMNTIYSPFVRFSEIAKEFLQSKNDSDSFQNFVNSWLAEPWEDTNLKTNADLVLERQTDIEEFIVPSWAKILTAGVDVQENCLYWTIRAFGDYITSQNIAHGQVFDFAELESVMNLQYKREDGDSMVVDLAYIDSGNNADEVYDFCASNSDWAVPVKGSSHPMLSHYKISKVNKTNSRAFGMALVLVDGGKYKDMIAARMKKKNGQGSWMVYQGCDREYAEQVTAEHKVNERSSNGQTKQVWVLKTSHADNHYLDCEVYALAAADYLNVRTLHLQSIEEKPAEPVPTKTDNEETWINTNERWL